jgi:exodeoxyribonuclease VII large subunit
LDELLKRILEKNRERCRFLADRLADLNPLQVLQRGFVLVEKDGRPVSSIKKIQNNDIISVRWRDGRANAQVQELYGL